MATTDFFTWEKAAFGKLNREMGIDLSKMLPKPITMVNPLEVPEADETDEDQNGKNFKQQEGAPNLHTVPSTLEW